MPGLVDWVDFLTKLGFPTSTIIMGMWAWAERTERIRSENRHRSEREADRDEVRELTRDSILANQSATAAVSTLTSLLAAPRKGRG
jgi:hypothetical protein